MNTANNLLPINSNITGDLLEKIIIQNDLVGLKPIEKILYIKNLCNSLGLNYLTKPIQLLKFSGKEVIYFTKDATEQLRKINNISLTGIDGKIINGNIYVVTANAKTSDGRQDIATGAISIAGLKEEALCNAIMKVETKAKRRVTLSICGLGHMDESETDSIKDAIKVDIYSEPPKLLPVDNKSLTISDDKLHEMLADLMDCKTLNDLENNFREFYKTCGMVRDKDAMKKIIDMKNEVKNKLDLELNQELDDQAKMEENLGDIRGND
jgi:hypothetical protein